MAIEHSSIVDGERHDVKGLDGASAGQVYTASAPGAASWTAIPSPYDAEVIVKTAADLPAANLGVRTLAADTIYRLDGHIDLGSDTLVLSSNTYIKGVDAAKTSLTSTTTTNFITAASSFTLSGFGITCSTGTLFDCTGGAFESAYLKEMTINSASSLGSVHDWYSFFWDKGAAVSFTDKITFSGACNILIMDLVEFITGYTVAVDLDSATFNTCSFFRCGFGYASATNHMVVAVSGGNINAGKTGRLNFCSFASITTPISGYTLADVQWESFDNLGLSSSAKAAQTYLHIQTDTTGLVSTVPAVINGSTNFVTAIADQFTVTTGGRCTYNGLTSSTFSISVAIVGTSGSGTNVDFNHWLYINGTDKVVASKTRREYNSSAVGSPAPCMAVVQLEPNDYVELWVENDGGTQDWESHIVNIKITEVL
jgi:hypothetical protein